MSILDASSSPELDTGIPIFAAAAARGAGVRRMSAAAVPGPQEGAARRRAPAPRGARGHAAARAGAAHAPAAAQPAAGRRPHGGEGVGRCPLAAAAAAAAVGGRGPARAPPAACARAGPPPRPPRPPLALRCSGAGREPDAPLHAPCRPPAAHLSGGAAARARSESRSRVEGRGEVETCKHSKGRARGKGPAAVARGGRGARLRRRDAGGLRPAAPGPCPAPTPPRPPSQPTLARPSSRLKKFPYCPARPGFHVVGAHRGAVAEKQCFALRAGRLVLNRWCGAARPGPGGWERRRACGARSLSCLQVGGPTLGSGRWLCLGARGAGAARAVAGRQCRDSAGDAVGAGAGAAGHARAAARAAAASSQRKEWAFCGKGITAQGRTR
jgi:hypothetical protein